MHPALKYTFKVWLTSVLVSPLIITVYESIHLENIFADEIAFVVLGVLFGGIFSIPSAGVLCVTTHLILRTNLNNEAQKTVLTFIGVILTGLPILVITGNFDLTNDITYVLVTYASTIVAGIWIYRLQPESNDNLTDLQP